VLVLLLSMGRLWYALAKLWQTQWLVKPLSCQRRLWYALAKLWQTQWLVKPLSCQRRLWYALAKLWQTQWLVKPLSCQRRLWYASLNPPERVVVSLGQRRLWQGFGKLSCLLNQ
jgi:hypothetical protein